MLKVLLNGDVVIIEASKSMTLDYSLFGLGITGLNCPELRKYQENPKV